MSQAIAVSIAKLEGRAERIRELVDDRTHPDVVRRLQRAYAAIRGCAGLASELESAASRYADRKVADAKAAQASGTADIAGLKVSIGVLVASVDQLYQAADHLSNGRDAEAMKELGKQVLETTLKIGGKVSGVEYVKDAIEILEILGDAVRTGQAIKLRKGQAEVASDLLKWSDATTHAAVTWGFAAQQFLLGTDSKGDVANDAIMRLVAERMARAVSTWDKAQEDALRQEIAELSKR